MLLSMERLADALAELQILKARLLGSAGCAEAHTMPTDWRRCLTRQDVLRNRQHLWVMATGTAGAAGRGGSCA